MNIQTFNQLLSSISKTYQQTLSLRNELSAYSSEQIMESIDKNSQERGAESGWVTKGVIAEWLNTMQEQEGKNHQGINAQELGQIFPFEKISLTALIATCLKKTPSILQKPPINNSRTSMNPSLILTRIIANQLQTNKLRKKIVPLIQLYIPMSGNNLNLEQLKDYLLLGQNSNRNRPPVDAGYVILALNGHGGSSERLEFEMYKRGEGIVNKENFRVGELEKDGTGSMDKIRNIMNRLNKRVDNFGNQWLINRPSQKATLEASFYQQK